MRLELHFGRNSRWLLIILGLFLCISWGQAQAPGGVAGGVLWLKSDAGTSTTTDNTALNTWTTQMGATSATAGTAPIFRNNLTSNINFNPVVNFNGTTQFMNINSPLNLTGTTATVFSVQRMSSGAAGNDCILGAQTNTANGALFYIANSSAPYAFTISRQGAATVTSTNSIPATTPMITGVRRNGTNPINFYFNGTSESAASMSNTFASVNKRLGATMGSSNQWFLQADLAELIVYSTALSDNEVQQISSYLALKYGITLSHDYYASNWNGSTGTIFWNRTTNTGYNNNIAGIGRDDSGGSANAQLNQRQSRSINTAASGDLVTMALNAVAAHNGANTGSFSSNLSFLVWGDNGGANAWQLTESPAANRQRLTREWRVQETGTVGTVVVRVADNGASSGGKLPNEVNVVYLLVDADGDFSSGATSIAMTLNGTNWEVSYDFTNGQYFTFATQVSGFLSLSNITVSNCINHPLQDVATVSVQVAWENAPPNDTIEVSVYAKTERIFVAAGATSPQTRTFTVPANGSTNNTLSARWRRNPLLYTTSTTFNAPAACSNDTIACNILYLCGQEKPSDGDAWDHGFMEYLDQFNGSKIVHPILTKPDATGMGTYNVDNPTQFVNVNLSNYDLIVISATTENQIANDLVVALRDFSGSILNSNYKIINDLGMSNVEGTYQFQTHLFTNNSSSTQIYNFNNIYSSYTPVFTRGNYLSNADAYLWTNAGDQSAGINGVYFVYTRADVLPGVSSNHGRRVYLGYHMNGVYHNPQNGGALPAPVESWFYPARHLTLTGKTYFDQAILDAALSCNPEICVNGIDDNDNGFTDCTDPGCPGISFTTQPTSDVMCYGSNEVFTAVATGGTGINYQWQLNQTTWQNVSNGTPTNANYSGSNTNTLTISGMMPDGAYQYRLRATNSAGCSGVSNIATLTVRNTPANAGADVVSCNNPVITLNANAPAGYTGTWSVQYGTVSIANPNAANSNVTLTTANAGLIWTLTSHGCTSSDVVELEWVNLVVVASNNSPFCPGSEVRLFSLPSGLVSYAWTGPAGYTSTQQNPVIANATHAQSGNYTVTATDNKGCQASAQTTVTIYFAPSQPGAISY